MDLATLATAPAATCQPTSAIVTADHEHHVASGPHSGM